MSKGLVVCVEGPNDYVVRTSAGRKLRGFHQMNAAMNFAKRRLEKTGGRSLRVKGRLRYVSAKQAARAKKK
jgi:hypothetical protein